MGVNPNSIILIVTRIKAVNAKRPVANRKDPTEQTEKLLECIFSCSKHFSETATIESKIFAPAAGWGAFGDS